MKKSGNLISLISTIFLLLVGMVIAGCASPLMIAAYKGQSDVVRELLNNKDVDINEKNKYADTSGYTGGYTPLMCAVENGHIEVVKLLLDKGANVNINTAGVTAVDCAE